MTIKIVDNIRSFKLVKSLLSVARKLEGLFESRFIRRVRMIGFSLANKNSLFGVGWGNSSCSSWAGDPDYAQFLAVMKINGNPP